jgi:hypothetical protein
LVAGEEDLMSTELFDACFDRFVDCLELLCFLIGALGRVVSGSFLFEETASGDPDFVACRNALSGFVENAFGLVGSFETGEGEPEFDGGGDDFDGAGKEDAGVGGGGFEVDGFFPEADGGRDVFEGCVVGVRMKKNT